MAHRISSFVLAVIGVLAFASAPVTAGAMASRFTDVPVTHTAYKSVMWCAGQDIITGYADGTFRPGERVSSDGFRAMLGRAFGTEIEDNLVSGGELTRYGAASMVTAVTDVMGASTDSYDRQAVRGDILDYNSISPELEPAVTNAWALDVMKGLADGCFHGGEAVTRSQASVIIYRTARAVHAPGPNRVLTNGKDITEKNVSEMIAQLKAAYPSGTSFAGYSRMDVAESWEDNAIRDVVEGYIVTGTKDDICSTDTGCGGWAAFFEDYVFGQDARFRKSDMKNIRPGDLMLKLDSANRICHVQVYISPNRGYTLNQSVRMTNANNGLGVPTAAGTTAYLINWCDAPTGGSKWDVWTAYPD